MGHLGGASQGKRRMSRWRRGRLERHVVHVDVAESSNSLREVAFLLSLPLALSLLLV